MVISHMVIKYVTHTSYLILLIFFAEVIKQCHDYKVNAVILKQTVFCFFYCGPFLPKAKSKFVLNVSHDCRALQALVNAGWLPSA